MDTDDWELSGQYLTFTLREERFALPIARVHEVIDYTAMTRVPRMPEYMCGVVNLRGTVLPLIDLGLKLGMPPLVRQERSSIMIATIRYEGMPVEVGFLADSVQRVITLTPEQLLPPPAMGINLQGNFTSGVGHQDGHYFLLLEIDAVIASNGQMT